jgi:hypothetical protein
VRGTAGARDHNLEAAILRRVGIFIKPLRGPVRGDDLRLARHAELFERVCRVAHGFPIGAAAHDDADERLRHCPALKQLYNLARLGGRFWLGNRSFVAANRRYGGYGEFSRVFRAVKSRYESATDTEQRLRGNV